MFYKIEGLRKTESDKIPQMLRSGLLFGCWTKIGLFIGSPWGNQSIFILMAHWSTITQIYTKEEILCPE